VSFEAPVTLEKYRVDMRAVYGTVGDEQNGVFDIKPLGLHVIISSGEGWEHVSVSRRSRCPDYEDMCWAKDKFWGDSACVMQLHVPTEDHVNCHPYCLHLWRPTDQEIPRPPKIMVGPQ